MVSIRKYIRLKKTLHTIIDESFLIIKMESTEGEFIEVEDVQEIRGANLELSSGKPFYILLDTSNGFANASPEANKLMASKDFSEKRKATAIIARSLATKIVSNFFIQFNKPYTPTKVFTSEQAATDWLKSLEK